MCTYDELVSNDNETSQIMIPKSIIGMKCSLIWGNDTPWQCSPGKIWFVTLDCCQTQEVCKFVQLFWEPI